jgi:hypothetical protein
MPLDSTVVHRDRAGFQRQYGTLWHACEAYLTDQMLPAQAQAFENLVPPEFLAAVAQTRLLQALVGTHK